MANKQWVTEPLDINDKLNTVYYSPKKNIAPIKKKKKKDILETVEDVIGGTGKTILNTGIEIGKGVVDFGETILDSGLQLGSSKYNPYYMLHPEKLESAQSTVKDLVKVDASQKAIDETLGYGKKLSTGKTIQQTVDKGSLIKSTNLGGKIARGVGEMLPSIMTGNTASAAIVTGISGYGSGIETAYKDGASRSKTNLYGLGSAAINSATEMITDGIPGVKTKWLSGLDKLAEKGISKVGNEIAKSLVRAGYKVVGEGGEEAIAEMLDPYLKNITYDKNAKIDWQNVIDSAVQGGIIGGILNLPGTIGDVKQSIQTETSIPIKKGMTTNEMIESGKYPLEVKRISEINKEIKSIKQNLYKDNYTAEQKEVISNKIEQLENEKKSYQNGVRIQQENKAIIKNDETNEIDNDIKKRYEKEINSIIEQHKNDLTINQIDIDEIEQNDNILNKYYKEYDEKLENGEITEEQYDDFVNKINDIKDNILYENGYRAEEANGKMIYSQTEAIKKGYDEFLDFLSENNINYEISRSWNAGIVPSVYIKDADGEVIARVGNHKNSNMNELEKTYVNSDYVNWKDKLVKGIMEDSDGTELYDKFKSIKNKQEPKKGIAPVKKEKAIAPIKETNFNKQTGEVVEPIKPIKEIPKIAKLVDAKPVEIDKSVGNKVKDALQLTVNKGYYIDDYSEKSGNKEIKFKYDKMLSSDAEGQYEIAIGQTNNEGKIIGKSISDIWKPINDSGKKAEFSDYLLHKHNIDRMAQGKPIFGEDVTADMSKQKVNEYEANNPEFVDWSKDINTFNKNQLQNMVDAGLTSAETQELLNSMYDNYIRIQRDVKTGTAPITSNRGNVKIKNPLQKAKGGSQDILPLDESMAVQALQVKNAIRRNDLGLEMLKTSGGTITDSTNVLNKTEDGKYTFTVFKEGQPISIEVSKGIYNGLSNDLKNQIKEVEDKLSFVTKPIQKLSQSERSLLTTSNAFFIATNFFKDFQDGAFNSKYSRKFVKNYVKAISEITKNGDLWNLYQANGGNQNTYFDYKTGFKKDKKNVITKSIGKIQNINEIIEQAPRLAEFISTIEDGKSVTEAMYNAAEITTNFKRGGDITKALNRNGANFLNASIQGFDKQIRNIKGQNGLKGYVSLLAKATVWGVLPSLLNHLIYEDDDDYKKLTSDTKDRYFLFKTSDNNFIKIPKGRVLSIFGSATRRTLETPNGSEKNTKEFLNLIINQVAPNNPLEDNVLAPITQAIKNETWYGGEIVPQRLKDELAKNQYDETTDAFSKWLGSKINVSPKKINYVLDQYSGGIGDIILPLLTKQAEQNPISAKFTVNSIMSNKNVGEFFDTKEKLTKIANDSKANEEDILKSKYMNSVQAKANDLYKEKRDIQNSDLTDKEKTKEIRKIQSEINDMFTNALEEYKKPNIKSNYASIGDIEFYKKDNEWKKVSQDMSEKNNELEELDFDKNEYYKNYAKISEIYNKKIGTSQKKSDIIDVIKNSGLNNKQKAYMYTKYYSSKENTDIIIKLNINFDEYLKLEAQNIEATTNSTGTKVLRKRKDNYISAVNKLNLTIPQKALLIKNEYSSYDKYNNEIIKYVNDSNMTLNEKKSYLIGLGFKIKNGKVSW